MSRVRNIYTEQMGGGPSYPIETELPTTAAILAANSSVYSNVITAVPGALFSPRVSATATLTGTQAGHNQDVLSMFNYSNVTDDHLTSFTGLTSRPHYDGFTNSIVFTKDAREGLYTTHVTAGNYFINNFFTMIMIFDQEIASIGKTLWQVNTEQGTPPADASYMYTGSATALHAVVYNDYANQIISWPADTLVDNFQAYSFKCANTSNVYTGTTFKGGLATTGGAGFAYSSANLCIGGSRNYTDDTQPGLNGASLRLKFMCFISKELTTTDMNSIITEASTYCGI